MLFLFFLSSRRRHTRWPRDWSSDVCSSDLDLLEVGGVRGHGRDLALRGLDRLAGGVVEQAEQIVGRRGGCRCRCGGRSQIGRASCRERGWRTGGEGGGRRGWV